MSSNFFDLILPILGGQIRTWGAAVAGFIAAHGWASNDQSTAIVGGLIALGTAIWSAYHKTTVKPVPAKTNFK